MLLTWREVKRYQIQEKSCCIASHQKGSGNALPSCLHSNFKQFIIIHLPNIEKLRLIEFLCYVDECPKSYISSFSLKVSTNKKYPLRIIVLGIIIHSDRWGYNLYRIFRKSVFLKTLFRPF